MVCFGCYGLLGSLSLLGLLYICWCLLDVWLFVCLFLGDTSRCLFGLYTCCLLVCHFVCVHSLISVRVSAAYLGSVSLDFVYLFGFMGCLVRLLLFVMVFVAVLFFRIAWVIRWHSV